MRAIAWSHPAALEARNGPPLPGLDKLWAGLGRCEGAGWLALRGTAALVRTADGHARGARLVAFKGDLGELPESARYYWTSASGRDGALFLRLAFGVGP